MGHKMTLVNTPAWTPDYLLLIDKKSLMISNLNKSWPMHGSMISTYLELREVVAIFESTYFDIEIYFTPQ